MKISSTFLFPLVILIAIAVLPACKAKKLAAKPAMTDTAQVVQAPPPAQQSAPMQQPPPPPPQPPVEKPNYDFASILFEFNSGVLKTESYAILDKAASAMKMDPTVSFVLNGHASAEGTADHNMALSVERANSVKLYLLNTGVASKRLEVKGFGETMPVADNTTEDGRKLNRRVEIKKQ